MKHQAARTQAPAPVPRPTPSVRGAGHLGLRLWLTALTLFLPLKFGTVVVVGEIAMFPQSGWEWLFGLWPPFLLPALAGAALLATVLLYPVPARSRLWLLPAAWCLLAASGLLGLVRTTEGDAAQLLMWHLFGTAAFGLAVFWALHGDRRLGLWLLVAVCAGALLNGLYGWYQVKGGGFQETIDFVENQARVAGQAVSGNLASRLYQTRAFGFFVYPNSFAGHLVLTGPLTVFCLWRAGRLFEPQKVSRLLFVTMAVVLIAGGLWLSASRAAMLALGGGFAVAGLMQPVFKRWRLALVLAGVIGGIGLLLAVSQGRALESVGARFGYYRACLQMLGAQPATGVGLGEFFPHYMRLKPVGAEETRLPHNMLLGVAAQCGVAGLLAAALCLGLPLALGWLLRGPGGQSQALDPPLLFAGQIGLAAWSLHALADFNFEIASLPPLAAVLPLLLLSRPGAAPPTAGRAASAWTPGVSRVFRIAALLLACTCLAGLWRLPGEAAYQTLYNIGMQRDASPEAVEFAAATAGRLIPQSPQPWQFLGRFAEVYGAPALAAKAYREAALRTPHRATYWFHLTRAYLELNDRAAARAAFEHGLEWYPNSPQRPELEAALAADKP